MGPLGEIQIPFPFPSIPLDYFGIQDLKILLGIISVAIVVASSRRHYGLKYIFAGCLIVYKKTLNFELVNALAEIEVSFIK